MSGAQLSLLPLQAQLGLAAPPSVFGVSGYSGAGTTPSKRNDPAYLQDNLVPYSLSGHMHERCAVASAFFLGGGDPAHVLLRADAGSESVVGVLPHGASREVSFQLKQQIRFMPHVAPFFQGISLTVSVPLAKCVARRSLGSSGRNG